jgi:hypothetical protein
MALGMARWMVYRKVRELDVRTVPESAHEMVCPKVREMVVAKDGKKAR